MSLFTRREFIKSLLTLAGAAGLPGIKIQELEQELASPDISAIAPPSPEGRLTPAGYIQIDSTKYQVLAMSVTQERDIDVVSGWGDRATFYNAGLSHWAIEAIIKEFLPDNLLGKVVEFELIPTNEKRYLSGLIGKGRITEYTTELGSIGEITTFTLEGMNDPLSIRMANGEIVRIASPPPPEPEPILEIDDDDDEGDYWGGYLDTEYYDWEEDEE